MKLTIGHVKRKGYRFDVDTLLSTYFLLMTPYSPRKSCHRIVFTITEHLLML
jgi:hypothetical protein